MNPFNPKQQYLISPEEFFNLNPLRKYEILFESLDPFITPFFTSQKRGRPTTSKSAILNMLIYKNLKQLPTLFDLASTLVDNPRLTITCGLRPVKNLYSIEERLSSFLQHTPNRILQSIRINLIHELIQHKEISGTFLSIDSAPVPVIVKENNLKTSKTNRFDKTKPPKRDPQAGLGVMIYFEKPFRKQAQYFWGYRNHSITDCDSELPLWEHLHSACIHTYTGYSGSPESWQGSYQAVRISLHLCGS